MSVRINQIDRASIKGRTILTDEGYLLCSAVVTRSGVFDYLENGKINRRYRPPEEVFDEKSMRSMALKPVTAFHPFEKMVISDNAKELKVGTVGEKQTRHENDLMTNFIVMDQKAIDLIKSGVKELSLGYSCEIIRETGVTPEGLQFDSYQKNIKYNHLAIVPQGRAGNALIAIDSADSIQILNDSQNLKTEIKNMVSIQIDSVTAEVDPVLVEPINRLQADSKSLVSLKAEKDVLQAQHDSLVAETAKLTAEIVTLKDSQLDEKAIEAKASELADLKVVAKAQLDSIDGKGVDELKTELIKKAYPDIELDKKSEDYKSAMFDMAVKSFETDSKNTDILKKKTRALPDTQIDTKELSPRDAYIERFKSGGKK